ncbi:MAG: DUF1738 domain-containing protein [Synergistaceae bacterium]|nr:DUF1738 domain-containing protein [Synergistaceae bacterium]
MGWFNVHAYRNELARELSEALEKGTAPWQQPWSKVEKRWPRSAVTGRTYGGKNAVKLYAVSRKMGYTDPRWMTYNQAADMGCQVRWGEKGTRIIFYVEESRQARDQNGNLLRNPDGTIKYTHDYIPIIHTVFNAAQVIGADTHLPALQIRKPAPAVRCAKAERIIAESEAVIEFGGDEAYYDLLGDCIRLPDREKFFTPADYYATALHELTHWTGHTDRLNRDIKCGMLSSKYAFEELVAEIGSMFVSAETGIDQTQQHFNNHAAYVGAWITRIRSDKNTLPEAIRLAGQAAEFLLKYEREREKAQEKAS